LYLLTLKYLMMKKIILSLFVALFAFSGFAQNANNKFAFGINGFITDFYGPINKTFYKSGETNKGFGPSNFTFAYNLTNPLNIATSVEFGSIRNYPQSISDDLFWKWDAGLQFRFLSFLQDDGAWFDPYVYANAGVAQVNSNTNFLYNLGAGVNLWLSENFAFNVQSGWNDGIKELNFLETSFGIKFRFGKSDRDNDGVSDADDLCPDEAGLELLQGCPDKDNDGVADKDDACPDIAGVKTLSGCPDKDNDGIADKDDACPDVTGLKELNGCPDKDNDGIADKDDACPDVAGLKELNGCPDKDKDGIADKDDACPDVTGLKELNGCPDSDGDGIADKDDACPDVAGIKENNGCPKINKEEEKKLEQSLTFSAKNIQFESGKDILKKSSYKDLDNIVDIMKKYPYVRFAIEGYTDNTGRASSNLVLSQKRADAVKNYIVSKGIDGSRLKAKGYGIANPIATNKTSAGRAKNRRVEIKIIK